MRLTNILCLILYFLAGTALGRRADPSIRENLENVSRGNSKRGEKKTDAAFANSEEYDDLLEYDDDEEYGQHFSSLETNSSEESGEDDDVFDGIDEVDSSENMSMLNSEEDSSENGLTGVDQLFAKLLSKYPTYEIKKPDRHEILTVDLKLAGHLSMDEANELRNVVVGNMEQLYYLDPKVHPEGSPKDEFESSFTHPDHVMLRLRNSDGTLVAMSMFHPKSRLNHIDSLDLIELQVIEGYRSLGIGKFMLNFLETYCWYSGLPQIYLHVYKKNKDAQRLYKSLQFTEYTATDNHNPSMFIYNKLLWHIPENESNVHRKYTSSENQDDISEENEDFSKINFSKNEL